MRKLFAILAILFIPLICSSAGFESFTLNTAALGQAQAMVCRVDDASAVFYNPAALLRTDKNNAYVNGTIQKVSGDQTPTVLDVNTVKQVTGDAFLLNGYFAHRYSDTLAFGLGLYSPFRQKFEWPKGTLPTFITRESKLNTFYISPSVGYRITPNVSVGGGFDIIFADARYMRDFDLEEALAIFPTTTVDADGTDFGLNFGVLIDTEANWQFAATYKSSVDLNLEGTAVSTNITPPIEDLFVDGGATIQLTLPWRLTFGAATTYGDWEFEGNLVFTGWGSFDTLRVNYFDETAVIRDINLPRQYDNTFSIRLGAEYNYTEALTFRAGYMYDQSPVPLEALDPWLPDSSRNGISAGVSFHYEGLRVDFGYAGFWLNERKAPVDNFYNIPLNLSAEGIYTGSQHLLSFGAGYSF